MLQMLSPGEEIGHELRWLRRQIDRLELRFSQLAAAFERTEYRDEVGDNSAIDWIRFNCHMTRPAAANRVAVGERLFELPQSSKAMEAGEIGFAHLTILARTAEVVGKDSDETKLLELAKEHSRA